MNMKFLGFCAVLGCVAFVSDGMAGRSSMYSNIDMRNADGDTIRVNRAAVESYRDNYDYGYVRKSSGRSGMYDNMKTEYTGKNNYHRVEQPEPVMTSKRTYTKGETLKKSAMRKYFIANPFYQPLQGQFGSVTTGEYLEGKFKFDIVDRKLGEWSLKEDLSYGLTDRIALQAMAKYNSDKLVWKDYADNKDEYKSDGLNLYGFGLQGRIVDTDEWISTLSGYYEHQKHGIDYFIADLKAGYKVATSTIYGLGRLWAVNMEGDVYGDYINDATEWEMLVFGESKDTLYMGEAGLGVWTVLAQDWTLNVEGLYGWYDWHNQLSIKGAFGWQPNDWFALNLYAKTSLYDSANDKILDVVAWDEPLSVQTWNNAWETPWDEVNDRGHNLMKVSGFREWSVGLQMMFQF